MSGLRGPVIDRVLSRVIEDDNGCWIFTGSLARSGYGAVGVGRQQIALTHRVTYEYFIAAIPDGLHIDHLCRVRACCNPWHLEAVTQAENNRRSWLARGRQVSSCRRAGHPYTPENTYVAPGSGFRTCRQCIRDRAAA